jgi:hypothetical protein
MNLLRRVRAPDADQGTMNSVVLRNNQGEEDARLFQDFIESVSLSDEEFGAFLAMPGSSVPEIRRLFEGR